MITFGSVPRLADLYGWFPTTDPRLIERYFVEQQLLPAVHSDGCASLATESWRVFAPHRLAHDLTALAAPLERSLPGIPVAIKGDSPRSLLETFVEDGKNWLREVIMVCRDRW